MYTTIIFKPLYNAFILLADFLPWLDAGLLIILFTIIVKLILFPLSKKAVRTQAVMKQLEPDIKKLKEKFKDDKQALALETMKLYKEKNMNPFSSVLLLFIQLPILIALYSIFYKHGLSNINLDFLYPFVHVPPHISMTLLGFLDITQKNIWLAVITAATQYFQISLSTPPAPAKSEGDGFQENFARSMHMQMKYVLPLFILFASYKFGGALALYWTTSNLFMIGQELFIRRQMAKEQLAK